MRGFHRARVAIAAALLTASSLLPTALPLIAPAAASIQTQTSCENPSIQSEFMGEYQRDFSDHLVAGAQANIFPSTDIYHCYPPIAGDGGSGASSWVGIQPEVFSSGSIIQVGVINCQDDNGTNAPYCTGTSRGTLRYFAQYGGCPFGAPVVHYLDLGAAAPVANHTFQVRKSGGLAGTVTMTIANIVRTVSQSDPSISCWINNNTNVMAVYFGEVWNDGDSVGDSMSSQPTWFTVGKFQASPGGAWLDTGWSSILQHTGDHNTGRNFLAGYWTNPTEFRLWSQHE